MLNLSPPISDPMHLLIVQPQRSDVNLIVKALEETNKIFTYDVANSSETCQGFLKSVQYDAVLCADKVNNSTILDVWEWQQELNLEIPLILIAGKIGEKNAVNLIKAGISDYIEKNHLSELPEVLQRSLEECALRRQKKIELAQMRFSAQRERIINEIVQKMRGTLVLDEVLQTTVDLLHDALNVSRCLVSLLEQQKENQISYASLATIERSQWLGQNCFVWEFYEATLSKGNSVLISDIKQADLPSDILSKAKTYKIHGLFISPLLNQNIYLGNICLHQCDRPREWTGDEIVLMNTISDQCAIAIQQAKLFETIQEQANREQLLNEISRELNSQLDPNYILSHIVQKTGEYFQVNRVVIFSIQNQQVQVVNEWKSDKDVPSLVGFQAPLLEWSKNLEDWDLQGHYFLSDFNDKRSPKGASWDRQIDRGQIRSLLRVAIYIREEFFGAISLHTTKEDRTFDRDEIHLLERIADRTAIALYNAQSYERLEQLVKERTQELEQEKILSEAANRTKTEFLNNMSHELRTPLTGILGFSNVLKQEFFGSLNEKQKEYMDGITECGENLLNLINDLLDLSKIEADGEELNPQTLLVEEICQACLSLVRERAKNDGLSLQTEIADDVSFCFADIRRIKQIIFNLLSNAIKFTKTGSVTLKVWQNLDRNESKIYFSVIDTGIGISETEKPLIFEPFHQLDRGLSRKYEGTGLGLPLSQKLAQMHGGDITLESEVGQGSCFTLWLPLNLDKIKKECLID